MTYETKGVTLNLFRGLAHLEIFSQVQHDVEDKIIFVHSWQLRINFFDSPGPKGSEKNLKVESDLS